MSIEAVRVIPGRLPPTISTTPNSPRVCAKLRTSPLSNPGQERGTMILRKVRKRLAPRTAEASIERFKGVHQGLYREGETVEEGCENQPGEGEGQRMAETILRQFPNCAPWTEHDERIETEDGGRQDQGKRDDRFQHKFATPFGEGQPVGKRERNRRKND